MASEFDFYSGFNEIPEFAEASDSDKRLFGQMYADNLIAEDPDYFSDPAEQQALREAVMASINDNLGGILGSGIKPGEVWQDIKDLGSEEAEAITGLANRVRNRSFGENMKALGRFTEETALHTLGIPGRMMTSAAQLGYQVPSWLLERAGMGDSVANEWIEKNIEQLEVRKQQMDRFKTWMSKYEPQIMMAAAGGGLIGGGLRYASAKASGAMLELGLPGLSATDAALAGAFVGGAGQAMTSPIEEATGYYIDRSGYAPETKEILHTVMPIVWGMVGGATAEYKISKMIRDPNVVNHVADMARAGATPEQIGNELRKVKAPTLFEDTAQKADGIVAPEKAVSHAEYKTPRDAIENYFNQWIPGQKVDVSKPESAMARYYDSWLHSTEKIPGATKYQEAIVEMAKKRRSEAVKTLHRETVEALPAAKQVDEFWAEGKVSIDNFVEFNREGLEVLAKYYDPEKITKWIGVGPDDEVVDPMKIANMTQMAYRIPQNRPWTVEMFDDMIKVAEFSEGIWANAASKLDRPTVPKQELFDRITAYERQGRFSPEDSRFIKGMVRMLKENDELFHLQPVRQIDHTLGPAAGSYGFASNLIKLKDTRALPHEMGHWGFMNALSGKDRVDYLKLIRKKLGDGWAPGENLVVQKYMTHPKHQDKGFMGSNRELDPDEYFAEQFAQYVFTRNVPSSIMRRMYDKVERYMKFFFQGMKNENLIDQDMQPFFERFAVINKQQNLLHSDLTPFNKTVDALHDIVLKTRQMASRRKQHIHPDRFGDPLGKGQSFEVTKKYLRSLVAEAVEDGRVTAADARAFAQANDEAIATMLYDPKRSRIGMFAQEFGVTGVENSSLHKQYQAALSNEAGYIDPAFMRTVMLNTVPLIYGFEKEDDKLRWSANKYLKGAAVWYGLGLGGKAYRKIGGPGAVKRVGNKIADKFWGNLQKAAEGVPEQQGTMWQAVKKAGFEVLNSMRPTEGVDPEVWKLGTEFRAQQRQMVQKLERFVRDIKNTFTPDEREMIADFIEKEGGWRNVPIVLQEQAKEVQKVLRQVRGFLEDSGVDPAVVNRYGDEWLHRVYLPKLAQSKQYKGMKGRLKAIQGSYLMQRGKVEDLPNIKSKLGLAPAQVKKGDTIYSFLDNGNRRRWVHESQTQKLADMRKRYGAPKKWDVITPYKGTTRVKRDWTRTERQAMGESRDTALRLALFFKEAAHDIALGHMFKSIDQMPGAVLDIPKGMGRTDAVRYAKDLGYTYLPSDPGAKGIKRYGAVSGKFVRDDVYKVMRNLTTDRYQTEWVDDAMRAYRKAMGAWKVGKTAYQPQTHMLNAVTNLHITALDGRDPGAIVVNGIESVMKKDKFYHEAVDAGLLDSGIVRGEWDLDKFVTAVGTSNPNDPANVSKLSAGLAKAWQGVKGGAALPIKVYEKGDEIFKMGVFAAERRAGKTPQEALAAANKLFFDYSDVPSGVKFLRDTGIVPFITWTYKIMPVLAKGFAEHPERIAGMLIAYKALSDWTYENEFGDKAMAQKKLEEASRPEWQQKRLFGVGPSSSVRLPTDPETGEARFLEMGRYIPGADLFQDFTNSFPFGLHPAISLAYGWKSNKHAAFGTKLLPHDDPQTPIEKEENLDATISLIVNTLLPNVPGIPYTYSTERVGNALVASGAISPEDPVLWEIAQRRGWSGKNYFGHPVDPLEEVGTAMGIRTSRTDVDQAMGIKISQAKGIKRRAQKEMKKKMRDQRSTEAEIDRAIKNYEQAQGVSADKVDELIRLIEEAE